MIGTPNRAQKQLLRMIECLGEGSAMYLSPGCVEWGVCVTQADIPDLLPLGYIVLNADNLLGRSVVQETVIGDNENAWWFKIQGEMELANYEDHKCAGGGTNSRHSCDECESKAIRESRNARTAIKDAGFRVSEY